jgi:hypothetical protein
MNGLLESEEQLALLLQNLLHIQTEIAGHRSSAMGKAAFESHIKKPYLDRKSLKKLFQSQTVTLQSERKAWAV